MPERLTYRLDEAAEMLGVPVATVKAWVERGDLPSIRLGGERVPGKPGRPRGRLLIPAKALEDLAAGQ